MSHRLSVLIPDRLHDDIVAAARRDHVSQAAWVRRRLADACEGAGPRRGALDVAAFLTPREKQRLLERAFRRTT